MRSPILFLALTLASAPLAPQSSSQQPARPPAAPVGAATIQGSVRDGGHPAQAYIYVITAHPFGVAPPHTISRPDGTYNLKAVPPGDYRIVASVYPEQIPYRDPEALKPWLLRGRPLRLAPGAAVTLDLQVEPYD